MLALSYRSREPHEAPCREAQANLYWIRLTQPRNPYSHSQPTVSQSTIRYVNETINCQQTAGATVRPAETWTVTQLKPAQIAKPQCGKLKKWLLF